MPRTSTSPHAAADGAPGQGRAAPTGGAPAATRAAVKAAPAEPKVAAEARTAKPIEAAPSASPPGERHDAKAAKAPAKAERADGKVDEAVAGDKAATAHKATPTTRGTAHKPAAGDKAVGPTAHKPAAGDKPAAAAHKAAAGDRSAPKLDKAPARAEKATKAPAKAPAKTVTKPAPKVPAHRPAAHAPAHGSPSPPPAPPAAPKALAGGYAADVAFLDQQRQALLDERATYTEQARALRAEAESLVQEMEPGDVQFDDESGEGGTTTVDRERDLALSNQALAAVEEIDAALDKIAQGRYGICEGCGELIPQPRLEALPYARLCIACKSGGLSRR